MLLKTFEKNKNAQVGETITWFVATIIIILILIFGVYIAGASGVAKEVFGLDKEVSYVGSVDRIAEKSIYSYLLTVDSSEKKVYDEIKTNLDFSISNGNLAKSIFDGYYTIDYPIAIWLGFNFEGIGVRKNDFFGVKPTSIRNAGPDLGFSVDFVRYSVAVDKDKLLELILMDK